MAITRLLFLALSSLTCAACSTVASLESAIPAGTEVFEPRLLGRWEVMSGSDTNRLIVTREGPALYLIRWSQEREDSAVFSARLGPLGPRRWILELSPVDDTLKYQHAFMGRDSTRVSPPSRPLLIPVNVPVVIERPDSGLRLSIFDADSLQAYLTSHRAATPYVNRTRDADATLLLTETDSRRLNAFLQRFAARPGALIPLPRIGTRVMAPGIK